jgi:hypothetical protein
MTFLLQFNQEHKEMLGHYKMLLERGYIAINPAFDKLIISFKNSSSRRKHIRQGIYVICRYI